MTTNTPYNAVFNGYSLQNVYFRSQTIQHTNIPGRDLQVESRARADGFTIVNAKFTTKNIEISGKLSASSREALIEKIDEMKLKLNGISGNLDIDYGDGIRRYFATVSKLELPEEFYNINNVPYTIIFECNNPFGYATTSGVASFPANTAMLKDIILTVSGSINSDPVVFITINSGTQNMNLVRFSNESTGEIIVVTKPNAAYFLPADQLIINCSSKRVQINGSGLDYTGRFPTMNPPTQQLRLALQADAVNVDIIVNYLPAYI